MNLQTLLPLAFLPLAACGLNVFHTNVKGQAQVEGDPSPLAGVLSAFPGLSGFANLDFNQDQEFKNQGVGKNQVDSVTLDSLRLTISQPADQGFDFLETLRFYAQAEGLPEVLVAEKANISGLGLEAPNPTLELEVKEGVELKPYITAPAMSITVQGTGRYPRKDTTLDAVARFRVEFHVL